MRLLNTNTHAVYDENGHRVNGGGIFNGDAKQRDRMPGVIAVDSDEAQAWLSAHGRSPVDDPVTDPLLDVAGQAQRAARHLSTARIREPHIPAAAAVEEAAEAAARSKPSLDLSAAADLGVPAYGVGVHFAPGAENRADELVVKGELDAAALRAGGGNGDRGAYTVEDLDQIVESAEVHEQTRRTDGLGTITTASHTETGRGIVDPEVPQPPAAAPSGPDYEPQEGDVSTSLPAGQTVEGKDATEAAAEVKAENAEATGADEGDGDGDQGEAKAEAASGERAAFASESAHKVAREAGVVTKLPAGKGSSKSKPGAYTVDDVKKHVAATQGG